MSEAPLNDWLPMANADFRNWGPWIFHGKAKKRPAHVRVSYNNKTEPDTVIYLTEYGSGWGRNHSPTWEEIIWYRLRTDHSYYTAHLTTLCANAQSRTDQESLAAALAVPEVAAMWHALLTWDAAHRTGKNEPLQVAFELGQSALAAMKAGA